ncbi:MAG: hypothetical protein AMXMBFR75_31120 [Candidatus Hinthialibacteria bacterium]
MNGAKIWTERCHPSSVTARTAGITEHQTGKWNDPFTGLCYFHARWYDPPA